MRADAKAAQVASIGYTSAAHDLDATAATELTKVDVRMEGRPRTGPRICYPGMLFLQLNFSSDSWVPVDNKNWNTCSKYVRCSNYLCIRSGFERRHQETSSCGNSASIKKRGRSRNQLRSKICARCLGQVIERCVCVQKMHHSAIVWNRSILEIMEL